MNLLNLILNADSYKCSHWKQYPANTRNVFSYIESRGGKFKKSVMFGLQHTLKEYLTKPITMSDIDEAARFLAIHGEPFNREGWEYILNVHGGYLPVSIKAVPEGTVVPVGNILAFVESTDPECAWVVSYIETLLLRAVWYGTTVATTSWSIKQVIMKYLEETGDPSLINFKLHDFGARGVSSFESAGIGGAAHLVNFMGSDTITGVLFAMKYYNVDVVPGFSIPAAEHSTITTYGREGEVEAYRNMLRQYGGDGKMMAVVSDSYDIFNAVDNIWGKQLRQEVVDSGAVIVIRPDSGDPATVVLKCVQLLDQNFGSVVNSKGYKVLNYVRVIQGDGVCEESIIEILEALTAAGYSADNVAFGMGGALLQRLDRDTMKFAMKCSAVQVGDGWIDVFKDPITDPGKKSKKGRLKLVRMDCTGEYITMREDMFVKGPNQEVLVEVFRNGKIVCEYTFNEVRKNALM